MLEGEKYFLALKRSSSFLAAEAAIGATCLWQQRLGQSGAQCYIADIYLRPRL